MADLDRETVERVARWCAEAGRTASPAEIRAALEALAWDELLAARALLADPPPARPLGPYALADLARGVPPDLAAERERADRYPKAPAGASAGGAAESAVAPPPAAEAAHVRPARKGSRRARRLQVVVRKPRLAAAPLPPPALPLLDELLLPEGRAQLDRLVRTLGASRPRLVATLAASHRRADGAAIADPDLDRLLEHHGQEAAFARRERDGLLHALKAAGGVRARAAAALGYDAAAFEAGLARLGAAAEAERLRQSARQALRARATTVSEQARLILADPERLADLGLLEELTAALRARMPELVRALSGAGDGLSLPQALAGSLSLPVAAVRDLATRLGLDLGASRRSAEGPSAVGPGASGARSLDGRSRTPRVPGQVPSARPGGPRAAGGRPSPGGARPSGGPRPASGPRPSGGARAKGGSPRPASGRPPPRGPNPARSGPRPSFGGPRPSFGGTRPSGGGPRPAGSAGRRSAGPPRTPGRPAPTGAARPSGRGPRRGPAR